MPDLLPIAEIRRCATRILRKQHGSRCSPGEPLLVREGIRNRVLRCEVEGAPGLPTVILKQIDRDPARGFSDWAALRFLTERGEAHSLAPRFLGGDQEAGLFLMEDLGDSESVDTLLRACDPSASRAALEHLAARNAQLHLAARGGEREWDRMRAELPGAAEVGRGLEAAAWLKGCEKSLRWWEACGCPLPAGLDACLEQVAAAYREPGPFLTLTHGDPAPTNNHVRGEEVRLVDFEYAAFRHALYDMTGWDVLCPLPPAVVEEVQARYLAEWAGPVPDEAAFREGWGIMSAYRALAILSWISPEVLSENRIWVEDWTAREAVLTTVHRLQRNAALIAALAPVADAAATLYTALRYRWPEYGAESPPRWPGLA